jgi:hypothetical protein
VTSRLNRFDYTSSTITPNVEGHMTVKLEVADLNPEPAPYSYAVVSFYGTLGGFHGEE